MASSSEQSSHFFLVCIIGCVIVSLSAGGAYYYYKTTKTSSSSTVTPTTTSSATTTNGGLTASQIASIELLSQSKDQNYIQAEITAYKTQNLLNNQTYIQAEIAALKTLNQSTNQAYIQAEIAALKTLNQSTNQAYIKAELAAALTTATTGLTAAQVASIQAVSQSTDRAFIKAEVAALSTTATLTSNYLCPLNVLPSSGLCVSVGSLGQVNDGAILPYAKLTGKGTAYGFNSPMTLVLPVSYLKGGMTYNATTGLVSVPWPGLYEVKCQITLDINKQGYASISVNGGLRETYGRLFQSNATDATNGYDGSNTFAFAASDAVGLVLTKNGTNVGSIQGNYQDTVTYFSILHFDIML